MARVVNTGEVDSRDVFANTDVSVLFTFENRECGSLDSVRQWSLRTDHIQTGQRVLLFLSGYLSG